MSNFSSTKGSSQSTSATWMHAPALSLCPPVCFLFLFCLFAAGLKSIQPHPSEAVSLINYSTQSSSATHSPAGFADLSVHVSATRPSSAQLGFYYIVRCSVSKPGLSSGKLGREPHRGPGPSLGLLSSILRWRLMRAAAIQQAGSCFDGRPSIPSAERENNWIT